MAERQIAVASAVVVPEAAASRSPTNSSAKRRGSSATPDPYTKRVRLTTTSENEQNKSTTDRRLGRRTSGQGEVEERKRGQRLFGNLLGTLSQSSSSTAQKRRADIEKKQQVKLKQQTEEYDGKKKAQLEELRKIRLKEQVKYDEQSMRTRHLNLLAMAHFMQTRTEPQLYYKPWEVTPEDETRIELQKKEAESIIERETEEFEQRRKGQKKQTSENTSDDPDIVPEKANGTDQEKKESNQESSKAVLVEALPLSIAKKDSQPPIGPTQDVVTDNDDGGDVMLEADEDTVIY